MKPGLHLLLASSVLFSGCSPDGAPATGSNTDPGGSTSTADTTAPVITLNGDASQAVDFASQYEDEGATASDDVDGAVEVTVEGQVDTFSPGEQLLTYVATDAAGNIATAVRTITVASPAFRLDVSVFGDVEITTDAGNTLVCNDGGDMCAASFTAGTEVVLTPVAASGWTFEYWRSCDAIDGDQCLVTMDRDRLVLATASSDAPLEYQPEVVILDEDQRAAIFNFDPENDLLFFEAGADVEDFAVGDVLIAIGESPEEVAFARRIIDVVSLSGSITTVQTIDVPLDEVILSGTLIGAPDAFQPPAEVAELAPGISYAVPPAPDQPMQLTVAGLVLYDKDDVKITATGTIDVDFTPEVAMDFNWGIRAFRLSGESEVEASLGIEISGSPDSLNVEAEYPLTPIEVGWVIMGPAVFVVEVEPYVTFEAGISVSVEPRVTVHQVATLGVQWHEDSDWTNLTSYQLDTDVEFVETLEVSARAQMGGGLKPSFKLYGVVGPYLKSQVYGGGEIVYEPLQECPFSRNLFAGFQFNAGGEISILSSRLAIESNDLSIETILASDTFGCEDDTPPDAPLGTLAVPRSTSTIQVGWQEATDDVGVTHYEIWRRDTNLGTPHRIAEAAGELYTDGGLTADTEYCYYVLAVDAAGNSSAIPLELACATTFAVDKEAPGAPELLSADALSTSSVALTWAAPDDDDIATYIIKDTTNPSLPFSVGASTTTEASITRLNAETEYCYVVSAVDSHGNESEDSNELCVTTNPLSSAEWTMYIGCEGADFILENHLDLDQDLSSAVLVVGTGTDYDGTTELAYGLIGSYEPSTSELSADIYWSFEGNEDQRLDRFTADLSTGDSGVVTMEQVQVTGCDAIIQFTNAKAFAPFAPSRPRTDIPGLGG